MLRTKTEDIDICVNKHKPTGIKKNQSFPPFSQQLNGGVKNTSIKKTSFTEKIKSSRSKLRTFHMKFNKETRKI
jgi:hypothetical protein